MDKHIDETPDKPISATEVNRFCYCAWQWYYERTYGQAHIRQLRKERNEALGWTGDGRNPFQEGLDFHEHYLDHYTTRTKARRWLVAAILVAAVFFALYMLYKIQV